MLEVQVSLLSLQATQAHLRRLSMHSQVSMQVLSMEERLLSTVMSPTSLKCLDMEANSGSQTV